MAVQLNHYHASSQHFFEYSEALHMGGRESTPEQFQQRLNPIPIATKLRSTSAADVQSPDVSAKIDPTTRLRALILAALSGNPVAPLVAAHPAIFGSLGIEPCWPLTARSRRRAV
jgi:hypothetical protein